jgi:ADP-heptose:LPS heptosyltransferase
LEAQVFKIVIIRQRPSIGDCLLLSPLIKQLKVKYPKSLLTVVTDSHYLGGALPTIFRGISGVDKIECIDSREWTTPGNQLVDPTLLGAATKPLPYTVNRADLVLDCNSAFMEFEREYSGITPYGISEFWLIKYGLPHSDILPQYNVPPEKEQEMLQWLGKQDTPLVGIVLRSARTPRDWDYNDMSTKIAAWLHSTGYTPVGIDLINRLKSPYGISCIGKQIDFIAALLKRCKLVLTPDTGLLHLAQAVGTPQVALWGILPPELRTKGYDCTLVPKESLGYCSEKEKDCQCPWKFQKWSCLRRITLGMVITGLQEGLSKCP